MKQPYTVTSDVYIHNDLSSCAFHFKERFANFGDEGGLTLEVMAALTMLAFANEAQFNVLGHRIVKNWVEKQGYKSKIQTVANALGLDIDLGKRPYQTLIMLNSFRDLLAHGKPETLTETGHTIIDDDFNIRNVLPKAEWQKHCSVDFFNLAYDDSDKIWRELLDASGLSVIELCSGGSFQQTSGL